MTMRLVNASLSAVLLAFPQSTTATVTGQVNDATNRGIPGVMIVISGERTQRVETDGQGRYRIEGLRSGRYTLSATLAGFAESRIEVALTNDAFDWSPVLSMTSSPWYKCPLLATDGGEVSHLC